MCGNRQQQVPGLTAARLIYKRAFYQIPRSAHLHVMVFRGIRVFTRKEVSIVNVYFEYICMYTRGSWGAHHRGSSLRPTLSCLSKAKQYLSDEHPGRSIFLVVVAAIIIIFPTPRRVRPHEQEMYGMAVGRTCVMRLEE